MLVRQTIHDMYDLPMDQIVFETEGNGKPVVRQLPSFHFNLSHSGDWVVCAVDDAPVGIDIEEIKPIDLAIAKRFFQRMSIRIYSHSRQNGRKRISFIYGQWRRPLSSWLEKAYPMGFRPLQPVCQRMDRLRWHYLIMKHLALFKLIHLTLPTKWRYAHESLLRLKALRGSLAVMCCPVFNNACFAEIPSLIDRLHVWSALLSPARCSAEEWSPFDRTAGNGGQLAEWKQMPFSASEWAGSWKSTGRHVHVYG